ncbi:hypothetical protein PN416_18510 [Halorubrum ezzemoulense]|uniref:hypothetical protein n=1 Tax=Halorubrum ezzemoulense TaxID=337243 RepID=UPI00232F7CE7|nr:hypothetical protein [Halorubrum ezzemoulense]MDB9281813.1 hypothetical protein [Halorubrum ezzemoulense]MDB9285353.1 hypothetical protein [Halorubrum ezzemoulense]
MTRRLLLGCSAVGNALVERARSARERPRAAPTAAFCLAIPSRRYDPAPAARL